MKIALFVFFAALLGLNISCGGVVNNNSDYTDNNVKESEIQAGKFSIQKKDNFTVLTILNPWQAAKNISLVYYLIRKDQEVPEGIDTSNVIRVPIESIICMSATYISMIASLNEENTIKGISGKNFIYSDLINSHIAAGEIYDVGFEASLNKELILKISPDLIMMYGIGSESSGYIGKIKDLGVKVLYNADYLETDPLSKAEWIKVFGALYCKEEMADSIFRSESDLYNNLKSHIQQSITYRPGVLLGLPYKDTWYISPGNSFVSKLISDAGGEYMWQNTDSEISMPFALENVYLRAMDADYWLNIGNVESRDEIAVFDERLMDLPCVKKGNLYNNIKKMTASGGNDYWERGTLYPHILLQDIAYILHPDLFPEYELFFYKKVN